MPQKYKTEKENPNIIMLIIWNKLRYETKIEPNEIRFTYLTENSEGKKQTTHKVHTSLPNGNDVFFYYWRSKEAFWSKRGY